MQIDDTLLAKLEKLSSLKIGEEKRKEIENQLSEILNFVDILDELDLSDVGAVVNSDVIETILKHAPMSSEHFFVVPKIIE